MRLTNDIRDAVQLALMKGKFDKDWDKLTKRKENLARKLYNHALSPKQRKILAEAPDEWFPTTSHIKAELGGCFDGHHLDENRRVPYGMQYACAVKLDKDHVLTQEHCDIKSAEIGLRDRQRALEAKLRGVLWACTTDKKLKEVWPEVGPIVDKITGSIPTANLPMLNTDDLTQAFALKKVS